MTIADLERKLAWTRAALAIVTPIVGLCFAAMSVLLLTRGEPTAAGVWMIAAMLTERK